MKLVNSRKRMAAGNLTSADSRKKLKRSSMKQKQSLFTGGLNSTETLSERAGMRSNAAIIDVTNPSILAVKLIMQSFIECGEDEDAYLYYILTVHRQGRTLVFCTSTAAVHHISSLLQILGVDVLTIHDQMKLEEQLKVVDHFHEIENGILVTTDTGIVGIKICGVRAVVHYQIPRDISVYFRRSGNREDHAEGYSIALISSSDRSFASFCKAGFKDRFSQFPLENSYMPEVLKRLSLARQIDEITRKDSQVNAEESCFDPNEGEQVNKYKQMKASAKQLKKLQQELSMLIQRPLPSKSFSPEYYEIPAWVPMDG